MKRAELKVVDRERTVPTPVKKKENALSIGEGWRAQHTVGHVDLHEKSGISLDRLLHGDVGHRLEARLRNLLDMRPQHAADDDRAGALDLEPIGRDHKGDGGQSRSEKNHEKRREKPAWTDHCHKHRSAALDAW